jgi:beta-phosphoglucomutase-like phosphatase (HAD superfamily)
MQKPKIDKIFLDMDGVIADFDKRYIELYGEKSAKTATKSESQFQEFINGQNFATLDLYPGALTLLKFLRSLPIPVDMLSSSASPEYHEEISRQKKIWLDTHQITFHPIFVPGKHLKAQYATPNSILIDDDDQNIKDWNAAGGIGVLHKNELSTICILKMYV